MSMLFLLVGIVRPLPNLADDTIQFAQAPVIPNWMIFKNYPEVDVAIVEIIPDSIEENTGIGSLSSITKFIIRYIESGASVILLFHRKHKEFVSNKLLGAIKEMGGNSKCCLGWTCNYTDKGITTQEVDELIEYLRAHGTSDLQAVEQ